MTLRTKIFGLFLLLAALPLLVLGVASNRSAERAVDVLVREQLRHLATRAAEAVDRKQALHRSDMLLLSGNSEVLRLYRARMNGRVSDPQSDSALAYLDELWTRMREEYSRIELVDAAGESWLAFGDETVVGGRRGAAEAPVVDPATGDTLGRVRAHVRENAFMPLSELTARFGTDGRITVLDRETGRVVYAGRPEPTPTGTTLPPLERLDTVKSDAMFNVSAPDGGQIGYAAALVRPLWNVVATTSRAEFAAPFERLARIQLAVLLFVTLLTTTAFGVLLHRATRSLRALTEAADEVGRGEFDVELPPARRDDVGRLTAAFGTMIGRIRAMIAHVEARQQMAVLGEFAARLSHELRNPLTAVKLNLQALDRDARADRLNGADAARPLGIALREIDRLDDVLSGVLDLARMDGGDRCAVHVHGVLRELRELLASQARQREVRIDIAAHAERDEVVAGPGELKGALLNLLLNALEAAPPETAVEVATNVGPDGMLAIRVRDRGDGVPAAVRGEIFRPFFTTRSGGTGLGLPLAARTAAELGGTLVLNEVASGAEFELRLPLAHRDAPQTVASGAR